MVHTSIKLIRRALEEGAGILRLAPTWVPRVFCVPGRRIKLHPDDYYALGAARGGIDERWFASTTHADNGPGTPPDEGLSSLVLEDGREEKRILLRDAVEELKGDLIGTRLWDAHRGWPIYSKFFDNMGPLPHHIHHRDEHAKRVGALGKPEAYYFPPQLNNHGGDFPHTFFGLNPDVTRDEVRDALRRFTKGDNRITALSRSYRLEVETGWDVPPGLLHAPGSLCTYEPQRASDVFAQYQSVVNGQVIPEAGLWKDMPPEAVGDYDYLLEVLDWDLNMDPDFHRHRFMRPIAVDGPRCGVQREVDLLPVGGFQRQGADRIPRSIGHRQGPGRVRAHRGARPWHAGEVGRGISNAYPVWSINLRRVLRE